MTALIGDGAFNFNPVPACLGLSQQYDLPLFIILCNNRGYASQKFNVAKYFPDGAGVRNNQYYGDVIAPSPDYSKLAVVWGGYGECVARPEDLEPSITRCMEAVDRGRFAILDVMLTRQRGSGSSRHGRPHRQANAQRPAHGRVCSRRSCGVRNARGTRLYRKRVAVQVQGLS